MDKTSKSDAQRAFEACSQATHNLAVLAQTTKRMIAAIEAGEPDENIDMLRKIRSVVDAAYDRVVIFCASLNELAGGPK